MLHLTSTYTLFPYTTLFRSELNEYLKRQHSSLKLANDEIEGALQSIKNGADSEDDISIEDEKQAVNQTKVVLSTIIVGILDRKSTRLNSSHVAISYAVFCLK